MTGAARSPRLMNVRLPGPRIVERGRQPLPRRAGARAQNDDAAVQPLHGQVRAVDRPILVRQQQQRRRRARDDQVQHWRLGANRLARVAQPPVGADGVDRHRVIDEVADEQQGPVLQRQRPGRHDPQRARRHARRERLHDAAPPRERHHLDAAAGRRRHVGHRAVGRDDQPARAARRSRGQRGHAPVAAPRPANPAQARIEAARDDSPTARAWPRPRPGRRRPSRAPARAAATRPDRRRRSRRSSTAPRTAARRPG